MTHTKYTYYNYIYFELAEKSGNEGVKIIGISIRPIQKKRGRFHGLGLYPRVQQVAYHDQERIAEDRTHTPAICRDDSPEFFGAIGGICIAGEYRKNGGYGCDVRIANPKGSGSA
ncbi:MAG: hypothetical protein LBM17_05530 [Candidatus Accumulibacter sp.]|nr:hypothetical protein [Accumulibacter sp.]